ncbi:MAG: DNA replication and repair protein RecF [Paludibacteraceae bacterium]|nr:DNA replication and repair protein RecF [Paludibacteraceae bacterium]
MYLDELHILNYKNIREAQLHFADKLNCFVGLNGQGKTNILDAIYLLSFTKSAYNAVDSMNITHGEEMAMVQGVYRGERDPQQAETLAYSDEQTKVRPGDRTSLKAGGDACVPGQAAPIGGEPITITCGMKRGQKKQFRNGKKDYKRMVDHIGLLPLVMVSPQDGRLIEDGSEERRRFLDVVISQHNKEYLNRLNTYNALLKQRNALLKEEEEKEAVCQCRDISSLLEVYELQMVPQAEYIYRERSRFVEHFIPLFQEIYSELSGDAEKVSLRYISQLQDRDLAEAYVRTRERDRILGWTSQGIHKDEIEMLLGDYPLKRVGSQGQQKTYLLAMKLAQALYLGKPILLLDDIFDKLDSERVARIVRLVNSDRFGQIFITDTDRQHLTDLLRPTPEAKIFHVEQGMIKE